MSQDHSELLSTLRTPCGRTTGHGDSCAPGWLCAACAEKARAADAIESQQAKIDVLMLEYCPEAMTPEQTQEWARHQRAASPEVPHQPEGETIGARLRRLDPPFPAKAHQPSGELPPLPEPMQDYPARGEATYTADQMREYAALCRSDAPAQPNLKEAK